MVAQRNDYVEPASFPSALERSTEDVPDMTPEELQALYDQTMQCFKEGEVVRGRVVEIGDEVVLVDIGYKSEGAISITEFPNPEEIQVGQEFDVFIDEPEDENGMPVLSKIKADKIKNWTQVQRVYEEDGVIRGRIVRRVKGGLKVDIGVDAFMPASQLTWRPTSDLDRYIGQEMDVKIIKLSKRRRNVVVSRRKLLEEQRADDKSRLMSTIAVGQIISGEVKNITDFGAFVDVGGIDGLLHVTDMSWGRVKHPSQVVQVGQRIEVMVLSFDPQTERISLGLKQKVPNPWKTAVDRYPVGSVVRGRVVSMTEYGAFVQLEDGIEGMVHVSEMSWTRRVRHPSELLSLDDEIDVMVLNVDPEGEKIALGLKQTRPNPWRELAVRYPVGSRIKGIVRNMTEYGAFVEIEEGIDALLHVSDLSWTKKISHPNEVLTKGQEIEVCVLSIDPENEKISVGLKQLEEDPWLKVVSATPIGSHVEVEITKLVPFGAFAKLNNDVEGLIHISELSVERVQKPEDVFSVGDKVMAKVVSVDQNERKIGLSVREYIRDKEKEAEAGYSMSGSAQVSIGDVLGDALPKSLLQEGTDIAAAANRLMQEFAQDVTEPSPSEQSGEKPETSENTEPVQGSGE
ncbi:MAG TPA: 30S ribosomal protein S1 [Candidatus Hydrogenedentes bacterium]|nr:30S ribosomal protein S1 [Candidatus Hydrogenedentota bacterium]HOL77167.1 30S ribosomal protein S1 [Candidatus Hydrogenedentota bacterium]HPO85894.1 30S ribosomal protein S1 [Candidatus Hydrogenedentota bacterium]